jgi:hypothetical protein
MKLLVDDLEPDDSVAIVTYAGSAGTVLEPTKGPRGQDRRGAGEPFGRRLDSRSGRYSPSLPARRAELRQGRRESA